MGTEDAVTDFRTTQWSMVQVAGQPECSDALAALSELCEAYWVPLYAFLRRHGYDVESAKDLTQAFFERLVARNDLQSLTPHKGKFRAYLLACLKHFVENERRKIRTRKRGGGHRFISLDTVEAREWTVQDTATGGIAEQEFDRRWAWSILERVLDRLRDECRVTGKQEQFNLLQSCLTDEDAGRQYAEAAARLDMSVAAVKMAASRLRRRFGELLRLEVAGTVSSPDDIDDEIRYLLAAVSR